MKFVTFDKTPDGQTKVTATTERRKYDAVLFEKPDLENLQNLLDNVIGEALIREFVSQLKKEGSIDEETRRNYKSISRTYRRIIRCMAQMFLEAIGLDAYSAYEILTRHIMNVAKERGDQESIQILRNLIARIRERHPTPGKGD